MIPRIGHRQHAVAESDTGWYIERCRTDGTARVAAFACEIRLADDNIGIHAIAIRHLVPDQQAMMTRIADDERAMGTTKTRAARAEEALPRRRDRRGERIARDP